MNANKLIHIRRVHIANKLHGQLHNKYAMVCEGPIYPSNQSPMGV